MPFYVSPEQLMKDRADYARKGISRGRSVVVLQYPDGIVIVSENPQTLHKVSEIYDRIAFAAVGRYNEFENLRIAGVRLADMRGYAYDRRDVTARGLANAYAQTLGTIFSSGGEKPYEVEIFVAEVGAAPEDDQIYRITYDGQMGDEHGFAVMGGSAEAVTTYLSERYTEGMSLDEAVRVAADALGHNESTPRTIPPENLEVAILDRTRSRERKFQRLTPDRLGAILGDREDASAPADADDSHGPTDTAEGEPPSQSHTAGQPTTPPVAPPSGPPSTGPSDPSVPPAEPGPTPPVDPSDPLS
jgi:proteasome alpha subunit